MRRTALATVALLSALALAGCTGTGGSGTSSSVSDGRVGGGVAVHPGVTGPVDGAAPATVPNSADTGTESDRRDVITTGSVSITAKDPIRAARDAVTITEQADGRIDSRTENPGTDNQAASASLTLRIPSNTLDRTLAELKKLGTVNYVSLSSADVTQQTVDLDARITSLRTSVDRLLDLMSKATTTADLITIENALAERQSELEGLTSQRGFLADQIEYSTITLDLTAEGVVAAGSPTDFWGAIAAGWAALLAAGSGLLLVIGYALPTLLVLAVLATIVLVVVRSVRSARRSTPPTPPSATDTDPQPQPQPQPQPPGDE